MRAYFAYLLNFNFKRSIERSICRSSSFEGQICTNFLKSIFLENTCCADLLEGWMGKEEGEGRIDSRVLFPGSKGVFLFSVRLIAGPVTNHDSSGRERRGHTTLGSVSGACCRRRRRRLSLAPLRLETPHPPAQLLRFATKSATRDRRRAAALYLPATSSS